MNELELKALWQETNLRLEQSIEISQKQNEEIIHLKVSHFIFSMKPIKIFTIIAGVLWVGIGIPFLVDIYLNHFHAANKFFLFSATVQVAITAVALSIYLYQMILIYKVDISLPVLSTQETLAKLLTSTLWSGRILFLELPVWATMFLSGSIFQSGNMTYLIVSGLVTVLFTVLAVWLFRNISFRNRDKKWFRLIFQGRKWVPIMRGMELLEEAEEFKKKDGDHEVRI